MAPYQHIKWYCSMMSTSGPKSSRSTKPQRTLNWMKSFIAVVKLKCFNCEATHKNQPPKIFGILKTIRIQDISGFELIVWPSQCIVQQIAYPLDVVVYTMRDFFHCHVEGQKTTQAPLLMDLELLEAFILSVLLEHSIS